VQAAITVLLLILVFWRLDIAASAQFVARTPLWFYVASLALLCLGQVVYAYKWQLILGAMGIAVPFRRVLAQYLIAMFFNNLLPTAIGGDVARVYYLGQTNGYVRVGTSVAVDRAFGFLAMATVGGALVWWLDISTPAFRAARDVMTLLFLMLLVGLLVLARMPVRRVVGLLRRWPALVTVASWLDRVVVSARPLQQRPGVIVAVSALVIAYFVPLTWTYRTYFRVADGVDTPYLGVLAVLVSIAILSNIPISVNGIGLREQLHYLLFAGLGVSRELAVSASVIVFSQLLVISAIGAVVWLAAWRRRADTAASPSLDPQPGDALGSRR
jgi:uncharacterized protein (TIRG00374 family)